MKLLTEFVSEHLTEDTSRLILNRDKWPGIDMDLAVNCIESRRKLKGKVQEWYDEPQLIFPAKLSAEQCSSSLTAEYKAALAERIFRSTCPEERGWKLADLTGGLGVDSWFFSRKASEVLYNEMQPALCEAARHNFSVLGAGNIRISNFAISTENSGTEITPEKLFSDFLPDIIYMDPARRGEGGKKVFLIEECTPDVLTLKDELFRHSRHILIKLSPMADISMACSRLGSTCREVHVVASGCECKELLIWADREWNEEYNVTAAEIHQNGEVAIISFKPSEEKEAEAVLYTEDTSLHGREVFLFEPGKALMKAGAFNIAGSVFGLAKLGKSTHYFVFEGNGDMAGKMKEYGKVYRILRLEGLDKRTIKAAGKDFPKAEVTARNIPMDTDTLRKKLGTSPDDKFHIFGLKSDVKGNLLLCTCRF